MNTPPCAIHLLLSDKTSRLIMVMEHSGMFCAPFHDECGQYSPLLVPEAYRNVTALLKLKRML